jgi:hypothetical protein
MTQAYNLAILANAVDTSGRLNVGTNATGTLPVANGGTGTTTPSLVAGTNISITGTWPNQTVTNTASAGGVTSLNGQTGAITNTSTNTIGSYIVAWGQNGGGAQNTYGSTISGSQLRVYSVGAGEGGTWFNTASDSGFLSNPGLSGTWRSMSSCRNGDGGPYTMQVNIWVRVS